MTSFASFLHHRWIRRVALAAGFVGAAWLGERLLGVLLPFPLERLERRQTGEWSRVVTASDGTWLRVTANRRGERALPLPLTEASPHLIHALLAAEDQRFFDHHGVDWLAVGRAAWSNLRHGGVVSGASTLTLQLVRIAEPRPRTLLSKLIEAFRARQLERSWTKEQLLAAYLDLAPLGSCRGFEAAAQRWFGGSARALDAAQAATLVAMLPAPSRLTPERSPQELKARRDRILAAMSDQGWLGAPAYVAASVKPLPDHSRVWPFEAPFWCDEVLAGRLQEGTLDRALERRIESLVANGDDAGADGAAVVVLGRADGEVKALVGGRDWSASHVDAALAPRDAGSTLKPFVYALGLSLGVAGLETRLADVPTAFGDWVPRNFDGRFDGAVRGGAALGLSRNVPAVTLLDDVTTDRFAALLLELGLPLPCGPLDLTAVLGTVAVSPLRLARAYRRFADPIAPLSLEPTARARVLAELADFAPLPGLPAGLPADRAIAWKTGTSSGRRDAWCVAVTPGAIVVVWLGNLDATGAADLVGLHAAAPLCAKVVAAL